MENQNNVTEQGLLILSDSSLSLVDNLEIGVGIILDSIEKNKPVLVKSGFMDDLQQQAFKVLVNDALHVSDSETFKLPQAPRSCGSFARPINQPSNSFGMMVSHLLEGGEKNDT